MEIDPELLPHLLSLNDDEVILPIRVLRKDVTKIRGLKLAVDEEEKVNHFQEYLYMRRYIGENTFSQLFTYIFNLAFSLHKQQADREAAEETT